MYTVTKVLRFCYGHRLLNYSGKCQHLHGHNGKVEVILSSPSLDSRGMVYDFEDVKTGLGVWVDQTLDHKMILCRKDPLVPLLERQGEPCFLLDENPTAENIAKLFFQQAKSIGLPVVEVLLWETDTSWAAYSEAS